MKHALKHNLFSKFATRQARSNLSILSAKSYSEKEAWSGFVDDTYSALVTGKSEIANEPNRLALQLHEAATSCPAFSRIENASAYHTSIAAKGTLKVAQAVFDVMRKEIERDEPKEDEQDSSEDGSKENGNGEASGISDDQLMALQGALCDTAEKLSREAKAVKLLRGIGLGESPLDDKDAITPELIDVVENMEELDDLLDFLGSEEMGTGSSINEIGICNVVGVTQGSHLNRLIPAEKAKLVHSVMGLETKKRLLNGETFIWEVEDDTYGQGDFVLMFDRSGSMTGSAMTWARSVAFSIMKKCFSEQRRIILTIFSSESDINTWVIDDKKSLAKAISELAGSPRGGTDFHKALISTAEFVAKNEDEENDVLVITDCLLPPFERRYWMNGKLFCAAIGAEVPDEFDAGVVINEKNKTNKLKVEKLFR